MKENVLNEALHNTLGLLYEKTYIAAQLTNEPSGRLDIQAFIDGKENCWQSLGTTKINHKKTLILASWYFQYLYQYGFEGLTALFGDLIDEGFTIYVPEEQQLIKATDKYSLKTQLSHFTPITSTTARKLAAGLQLPIEQIDIINVQRLHELAKRIDEHIIRPYTCKINSYFCNNYLALPTQLSPEQSQQMEALIEPDDKFSSGLDQGTTHLPSKILQRHIHTLALDNQSPLSDERLAIAYHICSIISKLGISTEELTSQTLSSLITAAPNLKEITITKCTSLSDNPLELAPAQLPHLIKLTIDCNLTANDLAPFLTAAPNIETLDITGCTNLEESLLHPKPGELNHLTKLKANYSSITTEQLTLIIAAAPNLATINISGCTNIGNALIHLKPGELSHLTSLYVNASSITAEQLSIILAATPNLETIEISSCKTLGKDLIHLKPGVLSHLTLLDLSYSSITSEQLTALIQAAPNLEKMRVEDSPNALAALQHLSPVQLSRLTTLTGYYPTTAEQLISIIMAAPNLEGVNFCKGKNLGEALLKLKPGQLNHFKKLDMPTDCTAEQLTDLIVAAPNLERIYLFLCDQLGKAPLNLGPGQLSCLIGLHANRSSLSTEQLASIISAAPNLVQIDISQCKNIVEGPLKIASGQLRHLLALNVNLTSITAEQLSSLLRDASNLKELNINDCENLGKGRLNLAPRQLIHLTELRASYLYSQHPARSITAEQLTDLIVAAPNLESINIFYCEQMGEEPLNLASAQLRHLTSLISSYAFITAEQLANIIAIAPNLVMLNISNCKHLGKAPLKIAPGQLSHLTTLHASQTDISAEQLANIISAAPNLESVAISFCKMLGSINTQLQLSAVELKTLAGLTAEQLLTALIELAEDAEFNAGKDIDLTPDEPSSYPTTTSSIRGASGGYGNSYPSSKEPTLESKKRQGAPSQISPDGQLSNDPTTTFHVAQLFRGHHGQPTTASYHLQSFNWVKPSEFVEHSLRQMMQEPIRPLIFPSLISVQNAFAESAVYDTDNHFYAQINLRRLKPNRWYQLPALSTHDQFLGYATDLAQHVIIRDKISGYYYLKVSRPIAACSINYIVSSSPEALEIRGAIEPSLLALMQRLQFSTFNGGLLQNEAYHQLKTYSKDTLIRLFTTFCNFPDASAKDLPDTLTSIEICNHLIQIRAGACRHRAMLFVALASEFGIDASLVTNVAHAFVTVVDDNQKSHAIDLGGAPAIVKEISMHVPKPMMKPAAADPSLLPDIQLPPENPFQTWNSLPLKAANLSALAKELKSSNHSTPRHLVVMNDTQAIEVLHEATLEPGEPAFFTQNLDSLSLRALKAVDGPYQIVDSPLAAFLKQSQLHPEQPMTWFINWSHPKAEHVGLNSIIDDVGRRLSDITLPDNLHIVVVIDPETAATMGEDFYSRFDAISQASKLSGLTTIQPATETITAIEPPDALLTTTDDWQNVLLGSYHIKGKTLEFIPGALINAVDNQSSSLRIHNAPWGDPDFRWFMTELLKTRCVHANGRVYQLPEALHIEFVQPLFHYPLIPKPTGATDECILNPMTYASFFLHHRVSSAGNIESCPGLLKPSSSLCLLVTEALSEAQWYQLWQEAEKQQCKIELQCTPKVTVPEALKSCLIKPQTLRPQEPIALVISNDLDDAEAHYPHAVHIPISPNTRFETLFCHVRRHEQGFISEETALLKAIRNGEPIVFTGQFSKTLALRLQTLFTKTPSLYVNGENIPIKAPIVFISSDSTSFAGIDQQTMHYTPNLDFQKLTAPLAAKLQALYQSLAITPCHSHFIDLPQNKALHKDWVDGLILQLQLAAGLPLAPKQATTPEDVLDYLMTHPFVFLLSETGAGKSYFVERVLRDYGTLRGRDMSIHHGIDSLKKWAESKGDAFLFIDEANLSAEHFNIFNNIARRERVIWLDGQCYPLSPQHKVIFAGNPKQYEGRFEADLFKRFPYFLEFKGQDLATILNPLLAYFEKGEELLHIIETYYQKAMEAGLNITARNAQMMCLKAFILKQLPLTEHMPDSFLMEYAALHEIRSLSSDELFTPAPDTKPQQDSIDQALAAQLPPFLAGDFIMTASRQKIAITLQTLLNIRELKISQNIDSSTGINGVVIEGEPGLGKSRLLITLLNAQHTPYIAITTGNPEIMRRQLLEAFHEGKVAIIDELNSFPDEQLLNALLSGTDLEGNRPTKPGFCLLCTQNPITYLGRQALSKALSNRLIRLDLNQYETTELRQILEEKFKLPSENAALLTAQYTASRHYAEQQKLFPPPNTRAVFKQAELELKHPDL